MKNKIKNKRLQELRLLEKKILSNRTTRRIITRKSHWWFFHIFLNHYVRYPIAPFHEEMFKISEKKHKLIIIMAFRGSGKSTIFNLSFALWSILGIKQKKCVLIISKTRDLAATHIRNIKQELEDNQLLRDDLGPFKEEGEKLGVLSLMLPHMGARIIGVSREQGIRGIRNGSYRPDLIICDDLEDSSSVSYEEREEIYRWFKDEVSTVGDQNTTIVMLGNLLHKDSLLMRLWGQVAEKEITGIFRAYPILDNRGKALWPGKFRSSDDIEELRKNITDKKTWKQEYLLVLPYNEAYDKPEYKKHLRWLLDFIENWRKDIGNHIYSPFLKRKRFRLSAPYGKEEFDIIHDNIRAEIERRDMEKGANNKIREKPSLHKTQNGRMKSTLNEFEEI